MMLSPNLVLTTGSDALCGFAEGICDNMGGKRLVVAVRKFPNDAAILMMMLLLIMLLRIEGAFGV